MIIKHLSEILPQYSGDFKRWFLSRSDREHPLSIQYVEVEGVVTPHSHPVEETIFYIEGKGIARVGEREIRIKPGTMLVIPPGTVHSSIREGMEPLRYLDISVGNPELQTRQFKVRPTVENQPASFTLEQMKIRLAKGGETSVVRAVPANIRQPTTCVIIGHGAGGPMHSPFIQFFHTELARQGFLTVKFNFPYMEARRKIPDKRDILEDCYRTVIEEAQNSKHKPSQTIIGGKSMGGRIASQIAATGTVKVDGLFFLGYPLHPLGKTDQLRDEHLYRINKPMLFLSGTRDGFARKDLLEKVLEKIGPNAKIHWIENGDHSFKTPGTKPGSNDGPHEALSVLLGWLDSLFPGRQKGF